MINDCEQLNIDNNWSMTKKNACHIGNQNEEMGIIKDDMLLMKNDMGYIKKDVVATKQEIIIINKTLTDTKENIIKIQTYQGITVWIWCAICVAIISLVAKKMWGK